MSIHYGVHPADPDQPGFRDWLAEEGVEFPIAKGHFPTLAELLETLHTFTGLAVKVEETGGTLISLGAPGQPGFAMILGEVSSDGSFHFFFEGSQNTDRTMAEILQKLSQRCGPFILREHFGATPLLIQQDTDLQVALQDWRLRFKAKCLGQ